jgi:pimeloyl-ACP methyl ester carboxylesterase
MNDRSLLVPLASLLAAPIFAVALSGCGSSTSGGADGGVAAATATITCGNVVEESKCDKTLRPFVFVHGTYGSGDNFAHVAALLGSNGYCQDRIVAVEYDSLGDSPGNDCTGSNSPAGCGKIDAAIDAVLKANPGFTQVDLAGHSQGTAHCATYLGVHADKVAHYINFSSPQNPNVGDVKTLSLSSLHDLGGHANHAFGTSTCTQDVDGGAPVPLPADSDAGADAASTADAAASGDAAVSGDGGAATPCNVIQVTFKDEDHFAVAASRNSFIQVYRYLNGHDPQYTDVQCGEDPVTIEGISETFADNTPVAGHVDMHELGSTPRQPGAAISAPASDASGHFGPFTLRRGVPYEMVGYDAKGNVIGYQYFSPFKRSNHLVRLLSPASAQDGTLAGGLIASQSTDHITRTPNSVGIVARWYGGAFRQDLGASLKIDGTEVLTDGNAGASAMQGQLAGGVVGFFMFDANQNGKTDLGLPFQGPFLGFTDVFIDATTPKLVTLTLTPGSEDPNASDTVTIANWPSSQGLVSITFQ